MIRYFRMHQPPPTAVHLLKKILNHQILDSALGDFEEIFQAKQKKYGPLIASLHYWIHIPAALPYFIRTQLKWLIDIFWADVKLNARHWSRYRLFTMINIVGLGVGLTAFYLIFIWVQDEVRYDRFHHHAHRIFRVERRWDFRDMQGQGAFTSIPLAPQLVRHYPEVEEAVRLYKMTTTIDDVQKRKIKQELLATDASFFSLFNFPLISGDSTTALMHPRSLVLTRACALKYLGSKDVLGQTISLEMGGEMVDFQITGVIKEIPSNSHFHFDMLISLTTFPPEFFIPWFGDAVYTYIRLQENVTAQSMESKFPEILTTHAKKDFNTYFGTDSEVTDVFQLRLRPLLSIHLNPSRVFEIENQGSRSTVNTFTIVAFFILLAACINFMNLSTARAGKRAKEVGLRKTIGAGKHLLWMQYLLESILMSMLALALAMLLLSLFLRGFGHLAGKHFALSTLFQSGHWLKLTGIALITGLFSGIYPSLVITSFQPIRVLRNSIQKGRGRIAFRKGLSVIQFVISITLIISTLVIFGQLSWMQKQPMGFQKENVITLRVLGNSLWASLPVFKNRMMQDHRIIAVSASSNIPGDAFFYDTNFRKKNTEEIFNFVVMSCDENYSDALNIGMQSGRFFSRDFPSDSLHSVVINEQAMKDLGYDSARDAVGKTLIMALPEGQFVETTVIGVLNPHHIQSLKHRISPLALRLSHQNWRYITIRFKPGHSQSLLNFIQESWDAIFPGVSFDYFYLDDYLTQQYHHEIRIRTLFIIFSILSIFIACLGLLGLSAHAAEERIKEIGIRRVMGASAGRIIIMLSWEMTVWVLLANLLAWPTALFFLKRWIMQFPFRMPLTMGPFLVAALAAFLVALFTVSFQAMCAAAANPVDSLRHE